MHAQRCRNRKDYTAAALSYQRAMELDGTNAFDLSMMAQCLEGVDDQAALEAAERALALDPKAFLALQTAACIQSRRGVHDIAAVYAERSLAILPDDSSPGFRVLCFIVRFVAAVPFLGRRVSRDELARCQHPEGYMHSWKKWAREYLDWYRAQSAHARGGSIH